MRRSRLTSRKSSRKSYRKSYLKKSRKSSKKYKASRKSYLKKTRKSSKKSSRANIYGGMVGAPQVPSYRGLVKLNGIVVARETDSFGELGDDKLIYDVKEGVNEGGTQYYDIIMMSGIPPGGLLALENAQVTGQLALPDLTAGEGEKQPLTIYVTTKTWGDFRSLSQSLKKANIRHNAIEIKPDKKPLKKLSIFKDTLNLNINNEIIQVFLEPKEAKTQMQATTTSINKLKKRAENMERERAQERERAAEASRMQDVADEEEQDKASMQGYTALGAPGMGLQEPHVPPNSPLPARAGESHAERIARIDRELARSEEKEFDNLRRKEKIRREAQERMGLYSREAKEGVSRMRSVKNYMPSLKNYMPSLKNKEDVAPPSIRGDVLSF